MKKKTFMNQSHFKLYDAIIPLFRLLSVLVLIGFTFYNQGIRHLQWSFSFVMLYLVYALILLFFGKFREWVVLKYPFIIGICETLIISYGVASTGGTDSPLYFSYVLVISFFSIVYHLTYAMVVCSFCGACYMGVLMLSGAEMSADLLFKFLFLFAFAVFIGSINGRISKYNIRMAIYDQLTALHNRQFFYGQLEHLLAEESGRTQFSLVVIDVNDFKLINDTYGHLEGDRILTEIGKIIQNMTRKADIAARYGGDEFVMLLTDTTRLQAVEISARLKKTVCERLGESVTVSVGYAAYPADGTEADALFHAADMAMYSEKQQKSVTVSRGRLTEQARQVSL